MLMCIQKDRDINSKTAYEHKKAEKDFIKNNENSKPKFFKKKKNKKIKN